MRAKPRSREAGDSAAGPPAAGPAPGGEAPALQPYVVNGCRLRSLARLNDLPAPDKEAIYRRLLPDDLLLRYGIDPASLCDAAGNRLVRITCPPGVGAVEIDVRPEVGFPDALLYLELADTALSQIEVLLFIINDPSGERFETDRDWHGQRTKFGTVRRNIPAEVRAMEAGLAPGQVRRGLRLTRTVLPLLENLVAGLCHDYFIMQPLAYHNAISFERMGFNYILGLRRMQWIHDEFQPGGSLHAALDGSTPFRRPDAWRTVRGRSWAIHDGVLGEPWHDIRMYKQVGKRAGIDTFPGRQY
jgi:hypothetical protein